MIGDLEEKSFSGVEETGIKLQQNGSEQKSKSWIQKTLGRDFSGVKNKEGSIDFWDGYKTHCNKTIGYTLRENS